MPISLSLSSKPSLAAVLLSGFVLYGCEPKSPVNETEQPPVLRVSNPLAQPANPALVEIAIDPAGPLAALVGRELSLVSGQQQLATQWVDRDADGQPDHLIAVADIAAGQALDFSLRQQAVAVDKKVQTDFWQRGLDAQDPDKLTRLTEAQVPASHTIGDKLYKYEGVGWESDKVAYRLYLDSRNVIDIFGKRTAQLVLQDVGVGHSYHELQDWGMDVLKVGPSLGMGGIGALVDGAVQRVETVDSLSYREVANGPLEAVAEIAQTGWQVGDAVVDISTRYRIHQGSRLTYVNARLSDATPQLVTGIVKHPGTELLQSQGQGEWSYLATFGEQSLVPDNLGMAVFYRNNSLDRLMEDAHSHVVVFKAGADRVNYAFMAAWQMDSSGVDSLENFKGMLDRQLAQLNQRVAAGWSE